MSVMLSVSGCVGAELTTSGASHRLAVLSRPPVPGEDDDDVNDRELTTNITTSGRCDAKPETVSCNGTVTPPGWKNLAPGSSSSGTPRKLVGNSRRKNHQEISATSGTTSGSDFCSVAPLGFEPEGRAASATDGDFDELTGYSGSERTAKFFWNDDVISCRSDDEAMPKFCLSALDGLSRSELPNGNTADSKDVMKALTQSVHCSHSDESCEDYNHGLPVCCHDNVSDKSSLCNFHHHHQLPVGFITSRKAVNPGFSGYAPLDSHPDILTRLKPSSEVNRIPDPVPTAAGRSTVTPHRSAAAIGVRAGCATFPPPSVSRDQGANWLPCGRKPEVGQLRATMTSSSGRDVITTGSCTDVRQHFSLPARPASDSNIAQTDPSAFASILCSRLHQLKTRLQATEQRQQQQLVVLSSASAKVIPAKSFPAKTSRASTAGGVLSLLSAARSHDDENAQSILERHLSRIWDSSDDVIGPRLTSHAEVGFRRRSDPSRHSWFSTTASCGTVSDDADDGTVPCADSEADAALCDAVCRLDTPRSISSDSEGGGWSDDVRSEPGGLDRRRCVRAIPSRVVTGSSSGAALANCVGTSDSCFWSDRLSRQSEKIHTTDENAQRNVTGINIDASCRSNSSTFMPTVTSAPSDVIVVGYFFCDDPVPYRTTVVGRYVTLRRFKQLLSKKGNFRYFFKKACDEFDCGVVNEEFFNDEDILPLWQGKVVGKIEPKL